MSRYVIERQYLVPMYEHILVDAANIEDACRRAADDIAEPWSEHAELDFDNSRSTTVVRVVEIPEPFFPHLRAREDGDSHDLSEVLYRSGLEALPIPNLDEKGDKVGFV